MVMMNDKVDSVNEYFLFTSHELGLLLVDRWSEVFTKKKVIDLDHIEDKLLTHRFVEGVDGYYIGNECVYRKQTICKYD